MSVAIKTTDQLKEDLKAAVERAGNLALDYFGKDLKIETKADGSKVSEADLAVNEVLKKELTALDPSIHWVSEESEMKNERLTAKRLWVVDPIDGTSSFLNHENDWTISAALVEDSKPIIGAVFNPPRGQFFLAKRGQGTTLNGAKVQTTTTKHLKDATVITSKTHFKRAFKEVTEKPDHYWRCSMAYRIALVAAGKVDATISLTPKSDWDIAASHLILEEAGGKISTAQGKEISYNQPELRHSSVVASTKSLYSAIIAHTSKDQTS